MVASPLPPASAPAIGGTSFAGDSVAVNVGFVVVVEGDVDDFEQPSGNQREGDDEQGQAFHLILLSRTCG